MKVGAEETLLKHQNEFIGYILTVAESSLTPAQFKAFKKLVLERFHSGLKPRIYDVFRKGQSRSGLDAANGQYR
ncbi:MAG: hypothetical protein R3B45_07565 [Bdellovibrionota bacterium]